MRYVLPIVIVASLSCAQTALATDYVAMSGKELYGRFCASCHGVEGRGNGPVAASFTIEVPDLTLISRRSGGRFPRDRVVQVIDGRSILGAHGSRTMPVWGEDLSRIELGTPNAERATRILIERLADYVSLLQRPAPEEKAAQ
jgi:mono/diheme cytochrome c family protein